MPRASLRVLGLLVLSLVLEITISPARVAQGSVDCAYTPGPSVAVLDDSSYGATWSDDATDCKDFAVIADYSALFSAQPAIVPYGFLTFAPAAESFGAANATATGNPDSPTSSFVITVLAVNDPPDCDSAYAAPNTLWAPNHEMVDESA